MLKRGGPGAGNTESPLAKREVPRMDAKIHNKNYQQINISNDEQVVFLRVTQKEAKALGIKYFLAKKPCKNGHYKRYASANGGCVDCKKSQERFTNPARKEAKAKGLLRYDTGRPCRYGHLAKRYVTTGACVECSKRNTIERSKNNIQNRISNNLRIRLRTALKRNQKIGSAIIDLGCSVEQLRIHLECQFDSKMTWDNYGRYWTIDHIKPLASFDLTDRAQFLEANNWSNLRPLERIQNIKKGSRVLRTEDISQPLAA